MITNGNTGSIDDATSLTDEQLSDDLDTDEGRPPSQAEIALKMADDMDLWHTPDRLTFATIRSDGHQEHWPIGSSRFKQFVRKRFYDEQGKPISSQAMSSAISLFEAKAGFDGEEHEVHFRVAEHDGNIYIDLCNSKWQAVEVTSAGWLVVDNPPVKFRRSASELPLPMPKRGGSVDLLKGFLNVAAASWVLIIAWLLAALRPCGPYPVLALFAQQGRGKSTVGRLLRLLIDPNKALLRLFDFD